MSRKKGRRGGAQDEGEESSDSPTVVDAVTTDEDGELEFDMAASARVLTACASLNSLAATAVEEATWAATPFLSFGQRSRIRALATRFDASAAWGAALVQAPAVRTVETRVEAGGGLSREEIDAIVAHRVEIAVTELLQKLGVAPDSTLSDQMERKVQAEIGGQEQRLLDWMKRHLTDSLEMLESTLDDRIADFLEVDPSRPDADVEAQLTEARENLLKNIDEVRTVKVGFDMDFAADIVELDRTTGSHDSAAIDAALEAGGDIEVGGEADEEDIELGGEADEEDFEVAADDDVEVAAGGDEEEDEVAAGDEDDFEIAAGGEDDFEIAAGGEDDLEIAVGGEDDLEIAVGGDVLEIAEGGDVLEIGAAGDVLELAVGGDDDDAEFEGGIELEIADDEANTNRVPTAAEEDLEISLNGSEVATEIALDDFDDLDAGDLVTVAEFEAPEELEEISVVQSMPSTLQPETEDIDELALAEAMEVELEEDDLSLMTLGEGPDEIRIDDLDDIGDEVAALEEVEVEIDDDDVADLEVTADEEAEATGDERLAMVAKYMDKAGQMNAKRQFTPAMELYSKVLDLDKTNFDALISRGVIYSDTKDYKRATEDFRAAQAIDPNRAGSYYGLAELHYNRRQFNKAIKNYSDALKFDDKLAEAWCRRGLSYYYQKNYKQAYLDLFRAYDIKPDLPKIKNFLKLVRNKLEQTGG